MGSAVAEGFKCKPQILDKTKPIMFSAVHLFLCEGERCQRKESRHLAERLRVLIRELGFDSGENRIKITRTFCNGACRFGQFAYAYKNCRAACFSEENAFTAWKNVHEWTDAQWKELFISLVENLDTPSIMDDRVEQAQFFPGSDTPFD